MLNFYIIRKIENCNKLFCSTFFTEIYAELYEKVRGVINMRKVKKVQNYFSELLLGKYLIFQFIFYLLFQHLNLKILDTSNKIIR